MLKHVTYRSTSSLGRVSSELTCRGSSGVCPDTLSLKGDLSPSPPRAPDTLSLKGEPLGDTISLKDDHHHHHHHLPLKEFPDTISLHSTLSFSSLATGRLSSRCSSTSSLSDSPSTPVKVYLRALRPDMEYKTLNLSSGTTCRQLVLMLLAKFRLRHRDPNIFFVTMEVTVRTPGSGAPARRLLVLDDQARPAELQQCRPRGDARFSVGVRRGGLVRVHDGILMPGSQYKSLLVSYRTTSDELVQLLLNCYNSKESSSRYAVHEVCSMPFSDRQLRRDECPLLVQSEWPRAARPRLSLVLRRTAAYGIPLPPRVAWRRSLDHSGTDTESEHEDHNTTIGSLHSTSSTSSALSISSGASVSSGSSVSSGASVSSGGSVSSGVSVSSGASVSSGDSLSSNTSVSSGASVSSGSSASSGTSVSSGASLSSNTSSSSGVFSSSSVPNSSPMSSPSKPCPSSSHTQSSPARVTSKPPVPTPHPAKPLTAFRTTSLPPTPVPRTILNTSTSRSSSLPTLQTGESNPSASSCTPSTVSSSTPISTSTTSSPPATPPRTVSVQGEGRPPPLPLRRTSCCRNYKNCFYI